MTFIKYIIRRVSITGFLEKYPKTKYDQELAVRRPLPCVGEVQFFSKLPDVRSTRRCCSIRCIYSVIEFIRFKTSDLLMYKAKEMSGDVQF